MSFVSWNVGKSFLIDVPSAYSPMLRFEHGLLTHSLLPKTETSLPISHASESLHIDQYYQQSPAHRRSLSARQPPHGHRSEPTMADRPPSVTLQVSYPLFQGEYWDSSRLAVNTPRFNYPPIALSLDGVSLNACHDLVYTDYSSLAKYINYKC